MSFRSNKHQSPAQGNRLSGSKKFSTIASAIGLKPKKVLTPAEEPTSPILPLPTADVEPPPPPVPPKSPVKPVPVAVGWTESRGVQPPISIVDSCQQSVFGTDIDPFATPEFPDSSPNVHESLRFSTFSEESTFESHARRDAHSRTSFASSSSLSHHRSDFTSEFSPVSSPLLSPATSGRHVSR